MYNSALNFQGRGQNIAILHLSCRTSDLQFSLVLQTKHLSFKGVCNKEHKGVIQDECFMKNYSSFLDFTGNYERMSGIFVPCRTFVKSVLQVFFLFLSQNMFLVLKKPVSMRRFFLAPNEHPKHMLKIYGEENIYNFTLKFFVYLNL